MDIKTFILAKIKEQGEVRASEIVKATGFSRVYINRFFQELRDQGEIILIGRANKAKYISATQSAVDTAIEQIREYHSILLNVDLKEDTVLTEIKQKTGVFLNVKENVLQIVSYALLEMINNAIEHSESPKIEVIMKNNGQIIHFEVIDSGIGIFNNIVKKLKLKTETEAIQELLKGKLTTAQTAHSGEGIFFTSRVADQLVIKSSDKKIIFNNLVQDQFLKTGKYLKGTKVRFTIGLDSNRLLPDVFKRYTDDSYKFEKTEVKVKLFGLGKEFLSRSQARRIISGLEKFSHIVLDFSGVDSIGQGFADEIFRVWGNNNPRSILTYINAHDDVIFMIEHVRENRK